MANNKDIYYELSHPQKRIWYIDKINSTSPLHNIGGSLIINGCIDIEIMRKAINIIIEKNDGMRLRFVEIDDKPMQYINEFHEQNIEFFDFSKCSEPESEYNKWSVKVFQQSFDLHLDDLFYFAIYKMNEKKYGILFKVHHIISDGWSTAIVQSQLCEIYSRLVKGEHIEFEKNCSYIDFIQDEAIYIDSEKFIKNKFFWVEKLKNPPNDFLYNSSSSVDGMRSEVDIDAELSNDLKCFIQSKKCSLNTFFIAAMIIYIYKTTGKQDIVLGTAVFNRMNKAQRSMIGMFTSTMPLRFFLNTEVLVEDLIIQLSGELKRCFFNQRYPYNLLVKDLELSKSGHDSLFKTTVNYYNMEMHCKMDNLNVTVDEHYNDSQSYSLQLIVKEFKEDHITLSFDYKIHEYTDLEIESMQKAIVYIAEQVKNEKLAVKDIKLLREEETKFKVYEFNATQRDYPYKTVHELFENQVIRSPDKTALEFKGFELTYKELNEKANQLANFLIENGIGEQSIIAILETHSPELVVSILGILKAGGAYLPIDPNYPAGRINYMLKDSGSKILLTNFETNTITFDGKIININEQDFSSYSIENLIYRRDMDDLAYIIYTSGSTGMPKGTMIKNKGLTNYIWWASKTYFDTSNEAMALYSSIAFDLTVTSVFAPLVSGNKIVIYDNDEAEFVLYKILRENKATVIKLTPAHLDLLKSVDYSNSSAKRLIVGGDDLKVSLAKEITDRFGSIEIYNEYGPTETVVGCMIHKFDKENDMGLSVPIGCPIDNVQVYILSDELDLIPAGLPGEIYISGDGVAAGYLNNEELTKEKFIDNPFVAGQKMYKTGDVARYLKNGLIEYLGRADNQVKVRGHRIELGEIEKCVLKIEGIKSAAVTLKKEPHGNSVLNAYVVAAEASDGSTIKKKLSETLPRYMIPTNFIFVDELPLTINGKIDFDSLPEPEAKTAEFEEGDTQPEKELLKAMSEVLGIDIISMNDNYYQLGGDSIKAIQISSKLINAGFSIKAKDILVGETVREIAAAIKLIDDELPEQGIVSGSFNLTPIAKWFFEQAFEYENHYNQSVVLKVSSFVDVVHVKNALKLLLSHHDSLRLNYDRLNEKLYYNNEISDIEVDYFDLSSHSSHDQDKLMQELGCKLKSGFDIENDALFKAGIFNLGERGSLIVFTAHHLVVDGVSWAIILEDFNYLWNCLKSNQNIDLPFKTHSFKEWSNWLNEYAKNRFDFEKMYWTNILEQDFNFPYDFDTGPDIVGMSATLSAELCCDETNQLLIKVNDIYNIGVHEALIIAVATAIKDLTAQNDIIIELEGHGREEMNSNINLSRTVGWFTSMYPVHLKVQDKTLDLNIKSLKEQVRSIPNKGFNFGVLKYLKNEFNESNYRFIRLNYLGNYDLSLKDKAFQLVDIDSGLDINKNNALSAIFDINAVILDSKLTIKINFSKNKFLEPTVQNFLDMCIERLSEIIALSNAESYKKFTPSDFSATDISQDDLDSLFS